MLIVVNMQFHTTFLNPGVVDPENQHVQVRLHVPPQSGRSAVGNWHMAVLGLTWPSGRGNPYQDSPEPNSIIFYIYSYIYSLWNLYIYIYIYITIK